MAVKTFAKAYRQRKKKPECRNQGRNTQGFLSGTLIEDTFVQTMISCNSLKKPIPKMQLHWTSDRNVKHEEEESCRLH